MNLKKQLGGEKISGEWNGEWSKNKDDKYYKWIGNYNDGKEYEYEGLIKPDIYFFSKNNITENEYFKLYETPKRTINKGTWDYNNPSYGKCYGIWNGDDGSHIDGVFIPKHKNILIVGSVYSPGYGDFEKIIKIKGYKDFLFVFNDNNYRIGKGGNAVIRDEKNAIGLITGVSNWPYKEEIIDYTYEDGTTKKINKNYHGFLSLNEKIKYKYENGNIEEITAKEAIDESINNIKNKIISGNYKIIIYSGQGNIGYNLFGETIYKDVKNYIDEQFFNLSCHYTIVKYIPNNDNRIILEIKEYANRIL